VKKVIIYTDGACSGNPGPGGWGAILFYQGNRKEINGAERETTNQRMELTAALMALLALKESCEVELFSDSAYLINAFNLGWIKNWQKNGWKNSKKAPVENQDLWHQLVEMTLKHKIIWNKVKGHAGHPENERCDFLARKAISELQP